VTLSVAMCTYNGEAFLREQLRSIAAQTRLPDELVICDDRSTDKTVDTLRQFAAENSFAVRIFENSENLGSTKNFERAFSLCQHDVIVPCDQDDSWYPDKLQSIEESFIQHPQAGFLFSDAEIADVSLNTTGNRLWKSLDFSAGLQRQVDSGCAFDALLRFNFVTGATMAFRSEYLPLVLPIPEAWIHDAWIAILIAAVAGVIKVDRPLIKYRQHSKQQLGPRRRGIRTHLATARVRDSHHEYQQKLNQYVLVSQRLQEQGAFEIDERIGNLLRIKIQHLACRAQLPKSNLRRLPTIGRELLLNHYRDFGHGWRGAARDFLVNLDDRI